VESGKAEDLLSCEGCADIVFFGIVLHDFENPLKVLANAHAMLKPTGKLVDLDWKKEPTEIGPPLNIRFSEEQANQLLTTSGFHTQLVLKSGLYHYIIMATLE
jgi:ubiquinone/menaquinone biosynthesis C-methylase UbiE